MTKTYSIIAAALCLILGNSCQSKPDAKAKAPQSAPMGTAAESVTATEHFVAGDSTEALFRVGRAQLENGNHTAAIKQFAYLRDNAQTSEDRDRAVIALSMALQDSGNRGAALGVLEPLPNLPRTGLEARKCILAGEIHLHQQNTALARTWLTRGLEVEPTSRKPYRASALFNLGKALLAENNLEDALTAFHEAREIFLLNGDEPSAKQCDTIAEDINRALL